MSNEEWHSTFLPVLEDRNAPSTGQGKEPEWTKQSILLCSQAARVCFSSGITADHNIRSTVDTWTNLWRSTQTWLETLPSDMHPIFLSPISTRRSIPPHYFPLVLHTSKSNMYSDVMYHTACMLLLEGKPPQIRSSWHLKSSTWHTLRICGICIGNNAEWSYDPTILAALIYAGRFISYRQQKKELVDFLRNIVQGSGWQMGIAVDEMIEQWQVDDANYFASV